MEMSLNDGLSNHFMFKVPDDWNPQTNTEIIGYLVSSYKQAILSVELTSFDFDTDFYGVESTREITESEYTHLYEYIKGAFKLLADNFLPLTFKR